MKTQTTTIENWQNYNIGQVHNDNSSRKKFSWKVKVKAPKIIKTKPFVKWAGGKRQIMSLILKNLPPKFNNYFEPFVGGGSVF